MHRLSKAANDFIRVLFEPGCAGCQQLLETPLRRAICDACWGGIEPVAAPFCEICGDELHGRAALAPRCERCSRHPPAFSMARSAGRHDGPMRELVHALKYQGRRLLAEPLGTLLLAAGRDVLASADAVVPVPLHPIRSMRRGFNQADDLARQLKLPVWRVLRRRRHGPSQTSLPASERRRNLETHFGLSLRAMAASRAARSGRSRVHGSKLVLIDDVMTTGATLEACARVLMDAGAVDVRALTVARAVAERPTRQLVQPRPSGPLH